MAVLDRVPVDHITDQARQADPAKVVLTVIAGVLFGLGWITAKVFGTLWLALAWAAVAVKVGWEQGRSASETGNHT